jgi:hypothetical protein
MTKVTSEAQNASPDPFVAEMNRILADVSKNPAQVEFPRDTWGMTVPLRKAGLKAASSIRGDEQKLAIFIGTLQVLAQHAKSRMDDDKAAIQARNDAINRHITNERAFGAPVPAPVSEQSVPMT